MPVTPFWPTSRLKLWMVPSTGTLADCSPTIAANAADRIAAWPNITWSGAVETVAGSRPEGSV